MAHLPSLERPQMGGLRKPRRRGKPGAARWLAPAALLLALAAAGCRTDAYDDKHPYTNPLDPSPTGTSTAVAGSVVISSVDTTLQVVTLVNQSGTTLGLGLWTLTQSTGSGIYSFGSTSTLTAAGFVRVHTGSGSNSATDLYSTAAPTWAVNSSALLKDNAGTLIYSCVIGGTTGTTC